MAKDGRLQASYTFAARLVPYMPSKQKPVAGHVLGRNAKQQTKSK